jgi:IS5 family transposase
MDATILQTKKGKQRHFGLKAHSGVDAKEGHVHSVATSPRCGATASIEANQRRSKMPLRRAQT